MINTFSFSYPTWYLVLCFAVGLGYAGLMYYRDQRFSDYSKWFTRFLAVIRFLTVSLICLLLLSPFVKTINEDIKRPLIVIASDQSTSVPLGEKDESFLKYQEQLYQLQSQFTENFEVKRINFGSDVSLDNQDSLIRNSTNFDKVFKYIDDNYSDQNLGAVILGSDGIFNEGANPLYSDLRFNAPLYTILLGDTVQKKDLFFQNVIHNKIAYLGDKFQVQVDISAFNCYNNYSKLTLEIVNGTQTRNIAIETLNINAEDFFTSKSFTVDANQSGVIRYRLSLQPLNGEFNTKNNVKEFFIEVLDARQKILLLANAPHPDIAALKSIILNNKNYEVDIAYASENKTDFSKYNLTILHNLPSENANIQNVLTILNKNNIPKIFIVGMQTSLPKFNQSQETITINGNSKNNEEVQAEFNSNFTLFTSSDELKTKLRTFPPLVAPFGEYKLNSTSSSFLNQNIKKIKTNYPLISFSEQNGVKTGVICGEGIWKWKLFDYLQNKSFDITSELLNKTIQLTSLKTDKRKFRANTSKNLYTESEKIIFEAQLYNDSYEMVNDPDVKLVVKNESNKEFNYTFSKTQNFYTLNADLFPQGSYNYVASTNFNGKVYSSIGKFNVESIQLEDFDLTARHSLMRSLSDKYNGSSYSVQDMLNINNAITENASIKPMMFQSSHTKSIIYLKWIFFLLLFFLTLEWFLRRYFGNY